MARPLNIEERVTRIEKQLIDVQNWILTVNQKRDARREREDAHDDGKPLERETEDRDEPGRNQPDPETDAPDLHG
jgi:hypothetical protein